MPAAIWWIRRDLRLHDNPALSAAQRAGDPLIPLFVLDEGLLEKYQKAGRRLDFLYAGLRALDADLRALGSHLVVRRGDPVEIVPRIAAESGAAGVFAQEDTHPDAWARDRQVAQSAALTLTEGTLIRPAGSIVKGDGDPYTVFTPFKRTWLDRPTPRRSDLLPAPDRLTPAGLDPGKLPGEAGREAPDFPAGAAEARRRLDRFAGEALAAYDQKRDFPGEPGTSQLSPYLRFGMISPREAAVLALEAMARGPESGRKGAETWLSELIWRDFYSHIEYHFPHVHSGNFNPAYDAIAWRNDPDEFRAWCDGRTGYPIVDAAMRQLNETGWMHNRCRMLVASFLVKDLLIDWRWGEAYFMERLVDGDPAANNGGWQWTAGTGTDAAPYFRIFNPVTQGKKFDPEGVYVTRWLPELEPVPVDYRQAPWEMSAADQERSGVHIGTHYPAPIVDHRSARQRTLDAYKQARDS